MAIDIMDFFNRQLPAAMTSNPADYQAIGAKFHLNITQELWGSWFIDASASGPSCTETSNNLTDGRADLTVTIAAVDFQQVMRDPQANFMSIFFAGKIICLGDSRLVMKFRDFLTLASGLNL